MVKMAKIKITLDKVNNLLSMTIRVGHVEKILRTPYGDNKVTMNESGLMGVVQALEMLTGRSINLLPIDEYTQACPQHYRCYTLELPVSECGKYLLMYTDH